MKFLNYLQEKHKLPKQISNESEFGKKLFEKIKNFIKSGQTIKINIDNKGFKVDDIDASKGIISYYFIKNSMLTKRINLTKDYKLYRITDSELLLKK